MTTLVANRQPLEVRSMNNQQERRLTRRRAGGLRRDHVPPEGNADAKVAADDYEQDDDFQFVRKSKRVKVDDQEPEPEPVKKPARGRPPAKGRAAKDQGTSVSTPNAAAATTTSTRTATKKPSRRMASVDASDDETELNVAKPTTRRSTRKAVEDTTELSQLNGASLSSHVRKKEKQPRATREANESTHHEVFSVEAKIALPMSDTPINNRNKEMRKKGNTNRRSSLGSRGRRASSLIESGQTAIPHREVDPAEFYKHIESQGLPEPRRMKQLLTWCGERALSEKPPHGTPNASAILGARAIQDQLLKDFASRSEFSDWFSRDDDVAKPRAVLKPNPRNIELDEKMAVLETKIKRLQEEKKAWLAIRKPPPEQPPLFSPQEAGQVTLPDFDLLDPDDGRIRGYLADEMASFDAVRSETEATLRRIQSSLEFEVDQLADNIHKLEQRAAVAGLEADKVLRLSAMRLRERDEREKTSAGTKDMPMMEVLRSLGNILPEGGG